MSIIKNEIPILETNSSETENLVYIDFDVVHDVDITIYPDSEKIGVWGMEINKLYPQASDVDYYDGEKNNWRKATWQMRLLLRYINYKGNLLWKSLF